MIFFDTNILVYSIANIDNNKQTICDSLIEEALANQSLSISPLVLSELIFTLSKLELDKITIQKGISLFSKCCKYDISKEITIEASKMAINLSRGSSINDFIHLKFAEKYCTKLTTFDKGFNQLKQYTNLIIEIL